MVVFTCFSVSDYEMDAIGMNGEVDGISIDEIGAKRRKKINRRNNTF